MTPELVAIRERLILDVDRIVATLDGLDAESAGWKPAPAASSLLAIARHVLGGTEQVVVLMSGGTFIRDRDREFLEPGDPDGIRALASEAKARIAVAFQAIDPASLDRAAAAPPTPAHPVQRRVPATWTGDARGQTVRDKLLERVAHVAEHAGHAELTRDLLAALRSSP